MTAEKHLLSTYANTQKNQCPCIFLKYQFACEQATVRCVRGLIFFRATIKIQAKLSLTKTENQKEGAAVEGKNGIKARVKGWSERVMDGGRGEEG